MGGLFSKKTDESPSIIQLNRDLEYGTELSSCWLDPNLRMIDALAVGVELRFLSFDSPKEFSVSLFEMNQEEVKIILDCKKDIWKNKELSKLVDEYFKNSLQTLDFCASLEKCLKKAQDRQLIFHALQRFEEEDGGMDGQKYLRTLEELKNFKTAEDPFTDEFLKIFRSFCKHQVMMENNLLLRKRKLDKKLKSVEAWRKVSGIIFAAAFAAFLISSVVIAAVAAPPVASALSAAASIPLGSMGKWVDSLWKNYGDALKGRKEVISSMQWGTYIVLKDLENIRVLVDRLEIEIEYLLQTVDFALEEAVKFGIEEIKKKLGVFMQSIDDLSGHIDECSRDIRRARAVVLERIIKLPNE